MRPYQLLCVCRIPWSTAWDIDWCPAHIRCLAQGSPPDTGIAAWYRDRWMAPGYLDGARGASYAPADTSLLGKTDAALMRKHLLGLLLGAYDVLLPVIVTGGGGF